MPFTAMNLTLHSISPEEVRMMFGKIGREGRGEGEECRKGKQADGIIQ